MVTKHLRSNLTCENFKHLPTTALLCLMVMSYGWTEQSTCQLSKLTVHLVPMVLYIADNQPFDCTIFVWRSHCAWWWVSPVWGPWHQTPAKLFDVWCRTKQVGIIFNVFLVSRGQLLFIFSWMEIYVFIWTIKIIYHQMKKNCNLKPFLIKFRLPHILLPHQFLKIDIIIIYPNMYSFYP